MTCSELCPVTYDQGATKAAGVAKSQRSRITRSRNISTTGAMTARTLAAGGGPEGRP
jgi:hypothetical protein